MINDIEKAISQFNKFKNTGYVHYNLPSSWSIEIAIQALEKQLPKKPMLMQFAEPEYMCECGMKYWRKGGVKYCIICGQKLDWSGKDEISS